LPNQADVLFRIIGDLQINARIAVTGPGQRIKQRSEIELAEPLLKTTQEIGALLTRDR